MEKGEEGIETMEVKSNAEVKKEDAKGEGRVEKG